MRSNWVRATLKSPSASKRLSLRFFKQTPFSLLLFVSIGVLCTSEVMALDPAKEASGPCPSGSYLAGRDTPWVPTPDVLVEAMLDLVELTPQDYVIDLGSGDGRMVIAAARRGASGHGIEYNPAMVECANWRAEQAGVTDQIRFLHGDMFTTDISKATVLPLFLLEENLHQLMPTFLALKPGTRIATNNFEIPGWQDVKSLTLSEDCGHWCTAYLWIVPARIGGVWKLDGAGELVITQEFQRISGTLSSKDGTQKVTGQMNGERITFMAGDNEYIGTVKDDKMTGQGTSGTWSATRTE